MVNASLMRIIGCAIFGLIGPVLGLNQYSLEVLHQSEIAFAHEAPTVYDNTLYFVSNILQDRTIQLNSFNLVTKRFSSNIQPSIPMPNGAITTFYGTILFCAQGNMTHPSGIYEFNPTTNVVTPILTGWNGFQFNSPNDLVLEGGVLSFTDPSYGFIQGFRPKPLFKGLVWNASYRWDGTRSWLTDVSPRKEVFQKPNGITTWGGKLYVSDTGYFVGNGTIDAEIPRVIYELDNGTKKIFALVDAGAPDGIKVYNDQLYAGCGDGVRIYSKKGELVNTIKVEGGVANFVIHENWIYMMNEKLLLRAKLQ